MDVMLYILYLWALRSISFCGIKTSNKHYGMHTHTRTGTIEYGLNTIVSIIANYRLLYSTKNFVYIIRSRSAISPKKNDKIYYLNYSNTIRTSTMMVEIYKQSQRKVSGHNVHNKSGCVFTMAMTVQILLLMKKVLSFLLFDRFVLMYPHIDRCCICFSQKEEKYKTSSKQLNDLYIHLLLNEMTAMKYFSRYSQWTYTYIAQRKLQRIEC